MAQFLSELKDDFLQNTNFGGYLVGRYTASSEDGDKGGFDVKSAFVSIDGRIMDFTYMVQAEYSMPTGEVERKVRLLDACVEWTKYKFARIKVGEFYRCFTFENPYHPWNTGFDDNSLAISKLVGGRDVGLQVQGDILCAHDGHSVLAYKAGVFNGQGMNVSDEDKQKDVMGGIIYTPVKDWSVGVWGWSGSYTEDGVKQRRKRWSVGMVHEKDWTVRAEYIASTGRNTTKSDAWYATVGVPVAKPLKVYAKWDVYREGKCMDGATSRYEVSANYYLCRNFRLQLDYYFTHKGENLTGDRNYHTLMAEVYCAF